MHINYSWNFHKNIFTLTISFIVLNAAIEFVLIYHPHPVWESQNLLERGQMSSSEKDGSREIIQQGAGTVPPSSTLSEGR